MKETRPFVFKLTAFRTKTWTFECHLKNTSQDKIVINEKLRKYYKRMVLSMLLMQLKLFYFQVLFKTNTIEERSKSMEIQTIWIINIFLLCSIQDDFFTSNFIIWFLLLHRAFIYYYYYDSYYLAYIWNTIWRTVLW